MQNNRLISGDSEYEIDGAYIRGALAMRSMIPWTCNPHRNGSQKADQWSYGHVNESAGVHITDSVDIITALPTGQTYTIHEITAV